MRLISLNGLASLAAMGLAACATATTASRPQVTDDQTAEDLAAAELREHHRHHHRGGALRFIAMGLDTLGPDDAQRPQVERLQGDLHACMAPSGAIEKKLLLTVADEVGAGTTGSAEVDADITRLEAAAVAVRDCSIMALNQLHALLTPAEREELVEKVNAHWEIWQEATEEEMAASRRPGGRLAGLARDVGLTPDQVEQISATLQASRQGHTRKFDRAAVAARVQAFGAAFVQESFDAKSIGMEQDALVASHGARRMVDFYEAVTPKLTREQRATLAEQLRVHASHQPSISAQ